VRYSLGTENLVIIGSGPAGLTAALYSARAKIDPLLIEGALTGGMAGGQLMTAGNIENFPAFPQAPSGPRLVALMREQITTYKVRTITDDVIEADLGSSPFAVVCSNGTRIHAMSIIVSTGAAVRRLPLKSEVKFWGHGVSACAICDGALPMFRNKPLAVIGGGDSAAEDALHLTQFGSKIYVIHRRDRLSASRIMQDRLQKHPKIEILWNKTVSEILGAEELTGVRLKDEKNGSFSALEVAGVFEAIGHIPNVSFLKNQLVLHVSGHIKTESGSTAASAAGVFAAGDVVDRKYRQAITASACGCMAAIDAERWLQEKGLLW
jgi:thioredoxin reductase (NADPH)